MDYYSLFCSNKDYDAMIIETTLTLQNLWPVIWEVSPSNFKKKPSPKFEDRPS